VSEQVGAHTFSIPWFKHYRPDVIDQYADAFRKSAAHYRDLLDGDPGNPAHLGDWHFFAHA